MSTSPLTPEQQATLAALKPYDSFEYARRNAKHEVGYYDAAKNQATVGTHNAYCFYSYQTLIAIRMDGQMYLSDAWNYSNTTRKYRFKFLNEGSDTTRQKLQDSTYIYLGHHYEL